MDDGKQDATTGGGKKQDAQKRKCVTAWWVDIIIVGILVLAGAAALPNYIYTTDGDHTGAEVKSNLHNIQLSIERYGVDHGGHYPPYLIGGHGKYSEFVEGNNESFINVTDCPDRSMLSDPLLREGYMEAYPRNPFVREGANVHEFQGRMGDPLRNGTKEASIHGTRFGPYCNLMGNVMADVRFTQFTVKDSKGIEHTYPTFADVQYPCSDIWRDKRQSSFLPGEFFYRVLPENVMVGGVMREEIRIYMLGAYGGFEDKGKDVIGPDSTGVNKVTPFAPDGHGEMAYGNPNKIADGIILVLVPAEDVPPKPNTETK